MKKIFFFFIMTYYCFSQDFSTPLETSSFTRLTDSKSLTSYLQEISKAKTIFEFDFMGSTPTGIKIPYVRISNGRFNFDKSKIKVMLFAQQHGNEPSGKEGLLLLLKDFATGNLNNLLDVMDIIIVPMMNPEGADKNERRNSLIIDLNRNHLILSSPEVLALHKLYSQFNPEVTVDIHEYSPYTKDFVENGYIKDWDEQIGCATNINVSNKIRDYSKSQFFPFIENYLDQYGFSYNEYVVGGYPEKDKIRFSTVDINDGRQSFGILNSFSFIIEGKGGKDSIYNIEHRSIGQKTAALGILEFVKQNKEFLLKLITDERKSNILLKQNDSVSIRMDHFNSGIPKELKLLSLFSNKDTIFRVNLFNDVVKSLLSVKKPFGYLIPKSDEKLKKFLDDHSITYFNSNNFQFTSIEGYKIDSVSEMELEDRKIPDVKVEIHNLNSTFKKADYYFVPSAQVASNKISLALEVQSMLGLHIYDEFKYLLKQNEIYPILRAIQ